MRFKSLFYVSLMMGTLASMDGVQAGGGPQSTVMYHQNMSLITTENYWTPERMRHALPMDLPMVSTYTRKKMSIDELMQKYKGQKTYMRQGALPTVDIKPDNHQYFKPLVTEETASLDVGVTNEHFSSQQLVPLSADLNYPYTTVGKLFFKTPSGDRTCSGVVLGNRVIATAAHCLHNGNGDISGWYSDWLFVPSFRDGTMPYSTWVFNGGVVYLDWYKSGGTIPNAVDYGFLSFADQKINGVTRKLGDVVGKLGVQTLSTIPNHAHLLGYPGNLDGGQKIHQVTAGSAVAVAPNNAEYGSDMSIGTGGGPWIQNFGPAAIGQTGGTNSSRNMLIGITSYGFQDNISLANGSSILDDQFVWLYNYLCNKTTNNC